MWSLGSRLPHKFSLGGQNLDAVVQCTCGKCILTRPNVSLPSLFSLEAVARSSCSGDIQFDTRGNSIKRQSYLTKPRTRMTISHPIPTTSTHSRLQRTELHRRTRSYFLAHDVAGLQELLAHLWEKQTRVRKLSIEQHHRRRKTKQYVTANRHLCSHLE